MELGSYSERQRQRDPLNVEQEPHVAAFHQGSSSRASALRSAFAGGWLGGGDSRNDAPGDDGEFSISGYSPYDVAYRGQAYGDSALISRTPQPDSKSRRFVFLLVGGLIATASVYFLYSRTPQPGLLGHTEGDPCVVDRSEACRAYPFYGGFDANVVRMIDADTTTKNFLFRSSMPLDSETHSLALHKVQMAAAEQAAGNGLQLPARAKILFFTLQWDGYNGPLLERCEIAREACQARPVPGVGTVHWPIFGQNVNPFRLPDDSRTALARTFTDWDADGLDQKVSILHQLVHVSAKENAAVFTTEDGKSVFSASPNEAQSGQGAQRDSVSAAKGGNGEHDDVSLTDDVPVISVIHCHHGVDRTGAVTAAYKMRFLGFSLDAVFKEARALGQNLVESIYSMMWYCLYLETALNLKTTQCYDVVTANANVPYFTNGRAPHTPPGVLPDPLPSPPLTPGPRVSEFLLGAEGRAGTRGSAPASKTKDALEKNGTESKAASPPSETAEKASAESAPHGEQKLHPDSASPKPTAASDPQVSPQPQLATHPVSSSPSADAASSLPASSASPAAVPQPAPSPPAAAEKTAAEASGEERH
ncbi:conserved hypothetical protein [Neospora caninum Liverpool]|uniref:Tyrosine specific protein phosphatases domain-containing protein n=1 Tax=Neospora caninum (strain Liverpool) TaxID=572307 RepID=F0V8G3_NEOCL|nr:conserved hypothetical protein [Neospora caninum Liverpool]CBZ50004.1 conserved hypothetical protein [Neospora caninum Liverpool]CEL64594.1 TPA: hypothetical protein BN1204_004810 [Neospora caninum Liverpool]|eukprot:XP_003880039.1 conserved hypothetical protein [Neospora caninum Liverpool]